TYIASLPSIAKNETWKNNTYAFPTGIIEKKVLSGKEPKSKTSIIFTGPFDWNRENRYIANSLLEVLDIKLRERLREDLGGTYSVNIYGNFQHLPLERFRISFQFGCDPDRIDELKSEIFLQIDSIKTNGPDESYLQKVRESQLRAYETNLKKNEFWISNLEFQYFHDQSIEDLLKYPDLVNGLTSEAIRDAANRYLDMDNYIRVILLPENYK
ncbi:MAG: insulinase family protein, partial [Calditrichales bacterium]